MRGQADIFYAMVISVVVIIAFMVGWFLYQNSVLALFQAENSSLSPTAQAQLSTADQKLQLSFSLLDYLIVIGFFAFYLVIILLALAVGAALFLLVFAVFDFILVIFLASAFKDILTSIGVALGITAFPALAWLHANFVAVNLVMAFITVIVSVVALVNSK